MVRLKVRIEAKEKLAVKYISIPYGSIKRPVAPGCPIAATVFQFLMVRLKGLRLCRARREVVLFQFLMVRLKAGLGRMVGSHYRISIPYGSIKRIA